MVSREHDTLYGRGCCSDSYLLAEADTVPTDAIPTIRSQDNPVHL